MLAHFSRCGAKWEECIAGSETKVARSPSGEHWLTTYRVAPLPVVTSSRRKILKILPIGCEPFSRPELAMRWLAGFGAVQNLRPGESGRRTCAQNDHRNSNSFCRVIRP